MKKMVVSITLLASVNNYGLDETEVETGNKQNLTPIFAHFNVEEVPLDDILAVPFDSEISSIVQ